MTPTLVHDRSVCSSGERVSTPSRPSLALRFRQLVSSPFRSTRTLAAVTVVALAAMAAPVHAQIVVNDFEDGTNQGWSPRGGVTLTNSTAASHGGARSLLTSGRTAGWNGPSLDLRTVLAPNTTYQISGWVRLLAGQPQSNLKFTLESRATGGTTTNYAQVNTPAAVTDAGWVQLQGTISFTAASHDVLTLYLESDDITSAYYLDDFTITNLSGGGDPAPPDQSGLETGFETATAEGWFPRGPVTLTVTDEAAASGSYSLSVTNRTQSWQGPAINVLGKLHKGSQYAIGVRVRLLPGQAPAPVRVSLQADFAGSTSYHTIIGNQTVTADAWTDFATLYTFGLDATQLQLYVESDTPNASFYIDDFIIDYVEPPEVQDLPPLKEVLAPYFDLGAAVEPAELAGVHSELLLLHFNTVVAGNAMKWGPLQPTEGNFNWGPADAIANFAREHGLKMRGHTLLWHSQNPAWLFRDANGNPLEPGNAAHRTLLIDRLRTHIHTVVARYADVVNDWDVVNEVIDTSGPNGLRNSPWLQIIGPEYIDLAFQFASEVPGVGNLYINDYNTHEPAKRTVLFNVVQGLIQRGIRIDGVGHQTHINIAWPPLTEIADSLDLFTGLGLDNQITELDISVYTNSTDTSPVTEEQLVQQGYRYRDLFNLFRAKSSQISSVTLWGLADDNTWLKNFPIARDDKPLLFDERLQAKHAYWGIVDPTLLPITPKTLNVTAKPRGLLYNLQTWAALAPVALETGDSSASWGQFRVTWSANALHLAVEIDDATRLRGDTVEVFLSGGQRFSFSGYGLMRRNGAQGLIAPTRDGYLLFASIPLSPSVAVGDEVVFDIRVTDGSTGRQLSWSDTHHAQHTDELAFGVLTLIPEKHVVSIGRGRPTIDGNADRVWRNATEIETDRFAFGSSGATARVKLLWSAGYLYIYAIVSDPLLSKASPNPWEEDSVEIFVDANNAQTNTYQADDAQYRINFDDEVTVGGSSSASNVTSATRLVNGGYVVEAAIRIDDASTVRGSVLGFDFQVNDDSGGGTRTSVATWNDVSGNAYQDPSQFGAIILR